MLYTIDSKIQYKEKIQRSEFICTIYPIRSMEHCQKLLSAHQKDYANATHNCFAYILGEAQEIQYYSDAGEPGGSAGKPILNSLMRAGLTGVLAVVTRYYGGIKLGVKGLIEAYGSVTALAAEHASKQPFVPRRTVHITCDYPAYEQISRFLHAYEAILEDSTFTDKVDLRIRFPRLDLDSLVAFLDGLKVQRELIYTLEQD